MYADDSYSGVNATDRFQARPSDRGEPAVDPLRSLTDGRG